MLPVVTRCPDAVLCSLPTDCLSASALLGGSYIDKAEFVDRWHDTDANGVKFEKMAIFVSYDSELPEYVAYDPYNVTYLG